MCYLILASATKPSIVWPELKFLYNSLNSIIGSAAGLITKKIIKTSDPQ
jgi:hypothetical protein